MCDTNGEETYHMKTEHGPTQQTELLHKHLTKQNCKIFDLELFVTTDSKY
jgi:hypothetical protein